MRLLLVTLALLLTSCLPPRWYVIGVAIETQGPWLIYVYMDGDKDPATFYGTGPAMKTVTERAEEHCFRFFVAAPQPYLLTVYQNGGYVTETTTWAWACFNVLTAE